MKTSTSIDIISLFLLPPAFFIKSNKILENLKNQKLIFHFVYKTFLYSRPKFNYSFNFIAK